MSATNFIAILSALCFSLRSSDARSFGFAASYQDNMVLQRAPYSAKLWGYADEGAFVSLTLFGKQYDTIATKADRKDSSTWKIILNPVEAVGQPVTIEVSHTSRDNVTSRIQLNNVLFGDVFVCGGQINMDMWLIKVFGGLEEVNSGSALSAIRLFQVARSNSTNPLNDFETFSIPWSLPTPSTLQKFSAVCWYFGKELNQRLNIPIGLIQSTFTGTVIEKWLPQESLTACNLKKNSVTSVHWNSMIRPLLSLSIFGVIWYQGESNREYNIDLYKCTFPALINDWRKQWFIGTDGSTNPQFPFGFVQLANNDIENTTVGTMPWLRFHQTG
jgi:sialate O-acetylesterase